MQQEVAAGNMCADNPFKDKNDTDWQIGRECQRKAWQEELYRAELVDVSQHIFCDLAGPWTMQKESALKVLHLDKVLKF